MEPIKNIVIDGVEHPVEKFSDQVRSLLVIRQDWAQQLVTERNAVVKTEAALRQLDTELTQLVQKELADTAANDEVAGDPAISES